MKRFFCSTVGKAHVFLKNFFRFFAMISYTKSRTNRGNIQANLSHTKRVFKKGINRSTAFDFKKKRVPSQNTMVSNDCIVRLFSRKNSRAVSDCKAQKRKELSFSFCNKKSTLLLHSPHAPS